MARTSTRKTTTKKIAKTKFAKTSGSVARILAAKEYGPEPEYNGELGNFELGRALTWYNNVIDRYEVGQQFLFDFLEKKNFTETLRAVKRADFSKVLPTVYWLARIQTMGGVLNERVDMNFRRMLHAIKTDGEAKAEARSEVARNNPLVQRAKLHKAMIEEYVADIMEISRERPDWKYDLIGDMAGAEVPVAVAQKILNAVPDASEHLKTQLSTYTNSSEAAQLPVAKPRKPRVKKIIPVEKKVAKLKFAAEYAPLNLKSVKPENIIDKTQLWLYDTKYHRLTVLNAPNGLQVKGTTILNFDEKTSITKRVGRIREQVLNDVLKGGKITLRKLMDSIKNDPVAANGRTNENTILLRVEK